MFPDYGDDVYYSVSSVATDELSEALPSPGKAERNDRTDEIKAEVLERLSETYSGREKEIGAAFRSLTKKLVRQRILTDHFRIDGRGITDIRALSAEVAVIPRAHGSALFERGETQIMGVTTLDMVKMAQQIDSLGPETSKRYMHHYNFPPYSTGETGRVGSPKRREIGHGALAERALVPVLPSIEEFPYAIRQVSEALSSNGSTSMGSVCASTLSLLNAGVPLKAPVAGIAMGLVSDDVEVEGGGTERRFVTLTDILGAEDAFGDMDFKVRRHQGLRHRTAARHQARRDPVAGAGRRTGTGQGRPHDHPRGDGRGHRRARRDEPVRAARSPRSRCRSTRSARSSGPRAR